MIQVYMSTKHETSSLVKFSNRRNSKRLKKIGHNNQSVLSTRDHSSNRSTTPSKHVENIRKPLKFSKENYSYHLDQIKQLDTIFSNLPKIHKNSNFKNKKSLYTSLENSKGDSISQNLNKYIPERSKSTFYSKKNKSKPVEKRKPEVSDLQKYLFEFQQKSKFLLNQLEQRVLGKDN